MNKEKWTKKNVFCSNILIWFYTRLGCHILDLGCGSGVDVYVLSKLVGATGRVTGVDMTEEQLQVALRHLQFHADAFGYAKSNVTILEGQIEELLRE